MIKRSALFVLIITVLTAICSCTLLVKPIDNNMHFSEKLEKLEGTIQNEDWKQAGYDLEETKKVWKKLKPMLQIDIDHDYVHEMEENLAELEAYIKTEEKPDALANLLLLKETWEDIESL